MKTVAAGEKGRDGEEGGDWRRSIAATTGEATVAGW